MNECLPIIRSRQCIGSQMLVDLTESANLYQTPTQAALYRAAVGTPTYRRDVEMPLRAAAKAIPRLMRQIGLTKNSSVEILDCGPADGEAAADGLDEMATLFSVEKCTVIDINPRLLRDVGRAIKQRRNVPVRTVLAPFEAYDVGPHRGQRPVVVLLGNTALNYEPADLRFMLSRVARPSDPIMIQVMLRRPGTTQLAPYRTAQVRRFVFEPLRHLGIHEEDVGSWIEQGKRDIMMGFRMKRKRDLPRMNLFLRPGDTLVTARTMRYSRGDYRAVCAALFATAKTHVEGAVATTVGLLKATGKT
jgi:hypothetical protein